VNDEKKRYCTDCRWLEKVPNLLFEAVKPLTLRRCTAPDARTLVGAYPYADEARATLGVCGYEGKLYAGLD